MPDFVSFCVDHYTILNSGKGQIRVKMQKRGDFQIPPNAKTVENTKNPASLRKRDWWGMVDSNHRRRSQQIYSLSPLATREIPHMN